MNKETYNPGQDSHQDSPDYPPDISSDGKAEIDPSPDYYPGGFQETLEAINED